MGNKSAFKIDDLSREYSSETKPGLFPSDTESNEQTKSNLLFA